MVELDTFLTTVSPPSSFLSVSVILYCALCSLQSREDMVFKLQAEVRTAAERLRFLLDFATLAEEDMKLNSQTFNWPARMEPIFEVSQARLTGRREKVEQELRTHREQFEARLEEYHAAVEVFQEKEVSRDLEDIRKVAGELQEVGVVLEACKAEAMGINNEEELLQWEVTPYPQIQAVQHMKEPYDRLWNTAISYYDKHQQWMDGEWAASTGQCIHIHTCM